MKDIQEENEQDNQINTPFIKRIFNKKSTRIILGILGGVVIGALYWEFIGCNGGSCPLTSNPTKTIILFGLMGGWFSYRK